MNEDFKTHLPWALMIAFEKNQRQILGRYAVEPRSLLSREVVYKMERGEKI